MTSTSIVSMPAIVRGRSRSVDGSVSASFRHGIWMISFFIETSDSSTLDSSTLDSGLYQFLDDAFPCDQPRTFVAGVSETRRKSLVGGEAIHCRGHGLFGRLADQAVFGIPHELERASGVRGRDDRLVGQKRSSVTYP